MNNSSINEDKFRELMRDLTKEDRGKFREFFSAISSEVSEDTLESISNLSESEYSVFMDIIRESVISDTSSTLEEIYYEDYDEIPVDILTFISDNRYLGKSFRQGDGVYDYWKDVLSNKIFNPGSKVVEVILSGCLTENVKVKLLNGEDVSIKHIVDNYDKDDYYLYTYDQDHHEYTVGKVSNVFNNGIKPVYRITLDNGEVIEATSNHQFLGRDGKSWMSIDDGLEVGSSLMPFNSVVDDSGYEWIDQPRGEDSFRKLTHKVVSIELIGDRPTYDIEVEGTHNFVLSSGVVAHNSIGTGKSTISVVGLMYIMYKLLCLKNPASYYRLAEGSKIAVALFNMTADSVYGIGWDKIQTYAKNSPWFLENGNLVGRPAVRLTKLIAEGRTHEISQSELADCTWSPGKGIVIKSGSKASHFTGYDVFCLTGDTVIATSEGHMRLDEISNPVRVLTMNEETETYYSDPVEVMLTKVVDELIEIEMEDGTLIRCTPDHKLRLTNGSYVEAQFLTEDDDIMEVKLL